MKKQNRIIAIFITAIMFFSLYTQPTVAAEASAAAFGVVSFKYCDGSGNAVKTLTARGTIKAIAEIEKLGTSKDATLLLMAYKNGKLIGLSSDKADFSKGNTDKVSAKLTMPADVTGVSVYAYIWNTLLGMEPIASGAVFGSGDAEIISAYIGDIKLEFDENGTAKVALPASYGSRPKVKAECADLSTTVSASYSDGVINLTAKAHSGAEKKYKVEFTAAKGEITDVKYVYGNKTYTGSDIRFAKVNKSLNKEDFYDEATGDYTKSIKDVYNVTEGSGLDEVVTPFVSNRYPYWFTYSIPEKFVGLNSILFPYYDGTQGTANATVTFTTNKSVRVYVSSVASHTDSDATSLGSYEIKFCTPGAGTAATTAFKSLSGNRTVTANMYQYDIIVPDGGAAVTKTIKLKAPGDWAFPRCYYEFIDNSASDEPENPVDPDPVDPDPVDPDPVDPDPVDPVTPTPAGDILSNLVYHYGSNDVSLTETAVLRKPDDKFKNAADTDTFASALSITDGAKVKDYASLAWSDRQCGIYWDFPDELVGKEYFPMRYQYGSDNIVSDYYVSFDFEINADTTVYFMGMGYSNRNTLIYLGANGEYESTVTSSGVTVGGDDKKITVTQVGENSNACVKHIYLSNDEFNTVKFSDIRKSMNGETTSTSKNYYFEQRDNRVWKADLILPDGATTAKYKISCSSDNYVPCTFAYCKYEKPLEVTGKVNGKDFNFDGSTLKIPTYTLDNNEESSTYGKYFLGKVVNYDAETKTATGSEGSVVWNQIANRLNSIKYHFIQTMPAELVGAKMQSWKPSEYGDPTDGVSMLTVTVNKTATLYFDTTDEFAESAGATKMDKGIGFLQGGSYYDECKTLTFDKGQVTDEGRPLHQGRLFKLVLTVPEGEKEKTFEIPLAWDTTKTDETKYPFAFIK